MLFGIDLTNYAAQKFGPATEYLFMHLFMQGWALFKLCCPIIKIPPVCFLSYWISADLIWILYLKTWTSLPLPVIMCEIVDNIHKVMCEVGRLGNNFSSRMALFMNVMYDCLCYAPALDPMRTTICLNLIPCALSPDLLRYAGTFFQNLKWCGNWQRIIKNVTAQYETACV